MKSEKPEWHNDDLHVVWRPPPRCLTCGGHRVASAKGNRPIATRWLGPWAWLAELPMRWLARSLRKKDSRTWAMEEQDPYLVFGTRVHDQIMQWHQEMGNDDKE